MSESTPSTPDRRSFAIPKAVIDALIGSQTDAITIGAYLTLAAHTDMTGQFSTAGLKAIRKNLSIDKPRAQKAIKALAEIRASTPPSNAVISTPSSSKKKLRLIQPTQSSCPIVYTREQWLTEGYPPPPGPEPTTEKVLREDPRIVRFVLPTFDEPLQERVWIGSALVQGDDLMEKPLRGLKDCGDVAARLLVVLYKAQDLLRWYGIPPCCEGFFEHRYCHYTEPLDGGHSVLLAKPQAVYGNTPFFMRLLALQKDQDFKEQKTKVWDAFTALQSMGFLYEATCLLNRHPTPFIQEKQPGDDPSYHGGIDKDADLLCDLSYDGIGGPVSPAEVPICDSYRLTTTDFGHSIYNNRLTLPMALVANGAPAMIAGLFRLRYRVRNPLNAFIEEADSTHLDRAKTQLNQLNYRRKIKGLDSLMEDTLKIHSTLQYSLMRLNLV
ncbi:MAG: hypothetical protein MRJ68_20900 [Nitrospira sp.]|nr:hypothetical protein [Nitrospira sp.]